MSAGGKIVQGSKARAGGVPSSSVMSIVGTCLIEGAVA